VKRLMAWWRKKTGQVWTFQIKVWLTEEWTDIQVRRDGRWLSLWVAGQQLARWRTRICRGFRLQTGTGREVSLHPERTTTGRSGTVGAESIKQAIQGAEAFGFHPSEEKRRWQ